MSWLVKLRQQARKDLVAAGSLLASVAALAVSIVSCQIALDAQNQAVTQFRQERQLVLTATFETPKASGSCSSIKAQPISQDFKFQEGRAYLPPEIYKEPIPIANDGDFHSMGSVCFDFQKFIKTKLPAKPGYTQVGDGAIPLFIESFYAVKGESYTDKSLYVLNTLIVVSDKEEELPSITFEGLSFVQRFPPEAPFNMKLLSDLANSPQGFYIKPKGP